MRRRAAPASERRSPSGIIASIALHLVVIAALGQITLGSHSLIGFFQRERAPVAMERVEFVTVAPGAPTEGREVRAGGDGRRITADPPAEPPPLVAPSTTPTSLPVGSDTAGAPRESGGRGPLVGGGGPLRGLQPAYTNPVFWAPPGAVAVTPKTMRERVDSSIVVAVDEYLDSLAALPAQREAGDWTVERDGKRWGIDREYIRLGDVSIPTSVLAVLPLNVQGNPIALERERAFNAQRADIQFHVQRGIVRDEVKAAVQRIRARVEAERAARAKIAQRGPVRPPPDVP